MQLLWNQQKAACRRPRSTGDLVIASNLGDSGESQSTRSDYDPRVPGLVAVAPILKHPETHYSVAEEDLVLLKTTQLLTCSLLTWIPPLQPSAKFRKSFSLVPHVHSFLTVSGQSSQLIWCPPYGYLDLHYSYNPTCDGVMTHNQGTQNRQA